MNRFHLPQRLSFAAVLLFFAVSPAFAACDQLKAQPDAWVKREVNAVVFAAHTFYERDSAQRSYERTIDRISGVVAKCALANDAGFRSRYPEFLDFIMTLAVGRRPDHELGFTAADAIYFAETRQYVQIPDFLLGPEFLRLVSRYETLPQAKAMLRELNAKRSPDNQLLFFSYESRHLGTPDNDNSFRRLLIVVPGNPGQGTPEKWVQFGITDPGARARVRNVSVVAAVPRPDSTTSVYFKDYFRTYQGNGAITVKGRWELGQGDDNCAGCHKSGILPIFPVAGSVSKDELPLVDKVNQRFLNYLRPRFDKYLETAKLGPGLGSATESSRTRRFGASFGQTGAGSAMTCSGCHQPAGLGSLNWPMDRILISSYVKSGQMPFGSRLTPGERNDLYEKLIQEYFSIDEQNPGILKSWLLGRLSKTSVSETQSVNLR